MSPLIWAVATLAFFLRKKFPKKEEPDGVTHLYRGHTGVVWTLFSQEAPNLNTTVTASENGKVAIVYNVDRNNRATLIRANPDEPVKSRMAITDLITNQDVPPLPQDNLE